MESKTKPKKKDSINNSQSTDLKDLSLQGLKSSRVGKYQILCMSDNLKNHVLVSLSMLKSSYPAEIYIVNCNLLKIIKLTIRPVTAELREINTQS